MIYRKAPIRLFWMGAFPIKYYCNWFSEVLGIYSTIFTDEVDLVKSDRPFFVEDIYYAPL